MSTVPGMSRLIGMSPDKGADGEENEGNSKEVFNHIARGIKQIYNDSVKPVEEKFLYSHFHSPLLTDGEIGAKPMVMLMGQYSVGKTTFITHLLGRDFPGSHVGPEPTTDRFMALLHGKEEKSIPGNALALQPHLPFGSLQAHGTGFLNKFEASILPCSILERITLIDTPGVLSGEKQRIGRSYEFAEIIKWFAERTDRILLLFDAHKLDISDEFKTCIDQLKGQDDKVRVVLNKCDSVDPQQLMRVHGALMWSLGKCIGTPEVVRVYLGSFWDQPTNPVGQLNATLFDREKTDLIEDLKSLPKNAALRKVNEFIKRARTVKTHALIIGHLQDQMPMMFGKEDKQQELIDNLADEFNAVRNEYNIPVGDFPNLQKMQEKLRGFNGSFRDFPAKSKNKVARLEAALLKDIPALIASIPGMTEAKPEAASGSNPFANPESSIQLNQMQPENRSRYEEDFANLQLQHSEMSGEPTTSLSGGVVAPHFQKKFEAVQREMLAKIWTLSDIDKDGNLDVDEFCIGMHLCAYLSSNGANVLPTTLPLTLVPAHKY